MNDTIHHLDNGDFEVDKTSSSDTKSKEVNTCQCLDSKPIMKCSENGIYSYCVKCLKGYTNNG